MTTTSSAPSRRAWVAASIAVLPQPMTATRAPTGICGQRLGVNLLDESERVDHLGKVFAGNAQPLAIAEPDADEDRVEVCSSSAALEIAPDLDAATEFHA